MGDWISLPLKRSVGAETELTWNQKTLLSKKKHFWQQKWEDQIVKMLIDF